MTVAGNVATKVLIAGLGDLGMAIARQLAQSACTCRASGELQQMRAAPAPVSM